MKLLKEKSFGEYLLKKELIKQEELELALERQKSIRKNIGEVLVDLGLIDPIDMIKSLSEFLGIPYILLSDRDIEPVKEERLNYKFLKQHRLLPLGYNDKDELIIVMANPLDYYTIEALELALGKKVEVYLGLENEILQAIEEHYGSGGSTMSMIIKDMTDEDLEILTTEEDEDIDALRDMASEAPVIRLVNLIITEAVEKRASDIHIEPFEGMLRLRYRIDGVLHDQEAPPKKLQAAIISRVKIMAGLNIAERRLPQDGRIRLRIHGRKIDIRVSNVPTLFGESVVMRLLDQSSIFRDLYSIGFLDDMLERFEKLIKKPHGIILVTGPTGSGKTTTLYAALDKINSPDKKIITIEDPVEYRMQGINQIQVNPKIGLTFANGLRHIVRQDPDIILIGEIRDLETAEIAIQSALTGHLVFSTLHTNDAPSAITRLIDMGVENYLVASTVEGIMAQRLVRLICPYCKYKYRPDSNILKLFNYDETIEGPIYLYRGKGCKECNNTGYYGRTAIFELMLIDDEIREMIVGKISSNKIRHAARRKGMRTLREDGWQKVKMGLTTVDEVIRVTQEEDIVFI